jgi:hypothetical protein
MGQKPPALKKRSGRSRKQTAVEGAPAERLPDWTNEELFVFGHGPLINGWFTRSQLVTWSKAQMRLRALGSSRSFGPLDYVATVKQIPHPMYPTVFGTLCVLMDTSHWSPPSPQPALSDG